MSSPWLGMAIIGTAFFITAALSWRKWPDVLVDFGMQLYLPWKISSGSLLYQDLNYLTGGPLSQYFHALLFRLFGVSLVTLVVCNLLIAGGLLVLIYRRFLAAADAWTATMIGLAIVLVFSFGQYTGIGNFNYITPYCHEVWHGLALSVVTIALFSSWLTNERTWLVIGAGACTGLVFMTKPEVFVALLAGVLVTFFLFGLKKKRAKTVFRSLAAYGLAFMVPLIGFAFYFHRTIGWWDSWRSVAFAWLPLLESPVSKNAYYKWCLGLDKPGLNLLAMNLHFLAVCTTLFISAVLFKRNMSVSLNRILALAWIGLVLMFAGEFNWIECGRSLPLLSAALCLLIVTKYKEMSIVAPPVFPLLWSFFGLVLLAKLGLHSRIWHYGFALAMPAFSATVYLLLWVLPNLMGKYGVHRQALRYAIGLVLMVGFVRLFIQSQFIYPYKTVEVGHGSDKIYAANLSVNPIGTAMNLAVAWIETNTPQDATLAVLPEGIMVNYLTRRTNPTKYFVWNPAELAAFGQDRATEAFQNNPPDYVMLIHREAAEYGARYFGQEENFGKDLMQWIHKNYESIWLIGNEPLKNALFGIKLLKKKDFNEYCHD